MTADLTLWLIDGERWQFMLRGIAGTGIETLNRRLNRTSASLTEPAEAAGVATDGTDVRLLVPAERVLATAVSLPARTRRQLQRALPFAVEEKLAIDLDRVHIASSSLRPDKPSRVRVVDPEYLEGALAKLRSMGLNVESVHSDADCLPLTSDIAVLIDGERALLRDRSGRALACARSVVAMVVGIASSTLRASESEVLSAIVHVQADAPLTPVELAELASALGNIAQTDALVVQPVLDAMSLLAGVRAVAARGAVALHSAGAPNRASLPGAPVAGDVATGVQPIALLPVDLLPVDLLQGRFARPRATKGEWKLWKPAAVAALLLACVQPLLDGGRAWRYEQDADRIDRETMALYTSLFPGETVPVDIRRAFAKRLGGDASSGVGFRPLLTALAEVTSNTPGFELQSISYQRERDELALQVTANSLSDLERFKSGFASRQLVAEVSSAEQEQERVRARLRVHSTTREAP